MIGLLLVAGVALILSSMKGSAPPSSSEQTEPSAQRAPPGSRVIPPAKVKNSLGPTRVMDSRYDAKGGLELLKYREMKSPSDLPTKAQPSSAVRSAPPVNVMPTARSRVALPSRFRVPILVPPKAGGDR